jgi:hypothetical protein
LLDSITISMMALRHKETQLRDIENNYIQHNDNRLRSELATISINNTQHQPSSVLMLSVIFLSVIMLSVIMLSVIMLSVIMLSVIMLSVIMLSVIMVSVIMLSVIILRIKC